MKQAIVAFIFLLMATCQPAPMHPNDPEQKIPNEVGSYEVYRGDTINRLDYAGRKQGKWINFLQGRAADTLFYKDGKLINK